MFNNLAKIIPSVSGSPRDYLGNRLSVTIYLNPVTTEEISKIIKELKNGAPGYDDITSAILKDSQLVINIPLCYLCRPTHLPQGAALFFCNSFCN